MTEVDAVVGPDGDRRPPRGRQCSARVRRRPPSRPRLPVPVRRHRRPGRSSARHARRTRRTMRSVSVPSYTARSCRVGRERPRPVAGGAHRRPCRGPDRAKPDAPSASSSSTWAGHASAWAGVSTCASVSSSRRPASSTTERPDAGPTQCRAGGRLLRARRRGRRRARARRSPSSSRPRCGTHPATALGDSRHVESVHGDGPRPRARPRSRPGPARGGDGPPTLRPTPWAGPGRSAPVRVAAARRTSARVTPAMSQVPLPHPRRRGWSWRVPSTTSASYGLRQSR